jgi:hypothetical protein
MNPFKWIRYRLIQVTCDHEHVHWFPSCAQRYKGMFQWEYVGYCYSCMKEMHKEYICQLCRQSKRHLHAEEI